MDRDAHTDDMARFLRLSDADVERLFRGLAPESDEDLRDLAGFLVDAAESLSRPPRSETEAGHLALLAEAVRARSDEGYWFARPVASTTEAPIPRPAERRGPMRLRTVRWAVKVALATASLVIVTAGLAFAGVDLPGTAAETAFQKVLGVELPNQAGGAADATDPADLPSDASDTAVGVLSVIQQWFDGSSWNGCEFGAHVSHAARGLDGEVDATHCAAVGSGGGAEASVGASAGAAGNAAEGLETADEASGGAASSGAGNADEGLETAEEASGGTASNGAGNADEGLETAGEASGGTASSGVGNADEGLGEADEASGGTASSGAGNADDGLETAGEASGGTGEAGGPNARS
jgi:hypothetical protein